MAKLEKHMDYNTAMFHGSKSAGLIFTLNQYVAVTKTLSNGSETEGEAFSVNYHTYKYEPYYKVEMKSVLAKRISELLSNNSNIIQDCNCIVAVPSNGLKPLIQLVAQDLQIRYIDALDKTHSYRMKDIEPVSKRKENTGLIMCKSQFDDDDCILLIDDFVESGTTFRECIKAIKSKSPNVKIVCVSLFRTEKTQMELE